ncbi:MAG: response regulator transcription factor [Verrucomicrobia bacterium]|nr:response regulator transcription factor [Verrucomicrobiota bacterium]
MCEESIIRVLVADDHPVVRAGLRATITEVDPNIVVVGEAANAAETMIAVRDLQPDVLLLDVRLPDRSGLDVCRDLKAARGAPRVLFLTSFADNALVLSAMQAGGDGYLLKDNEPRDIISAIYKVMHDGVIFDPVAARHAVAGLHQTSPLPQKALESLSAQELRVLQAVAAGQTDKEVASVLNLQTKTVRNYLDRVFEKLGVNTRTQAALLYDRHYRSQ